MDGSMIFKIYWDMGCKIILLIVEIGRNDQKHCYFVRKWPNG